MSGGKKLSVCAELGVTVWVVVAEMVMQASLANLPQRAFTCEMPSVCRSPPAHSCPATSLPLPLFPLPPSPRSLPAPLPTSPCPGRRCLPCCHGCWAT
jgi:hypothetical protein